MVHLLLVAILLPLAGAALCLGGPSAARRVALAAATATLVAAGVLVFCVPVDSLPGDATGGGGAAGMLPVSSPALHGQDARGTQSPVALRLSVGLDGLGLWFFVLAAVLSWVAVLVSGNAPGGRTAGYYRLLLATESGMLGAFAARDVILFYVCFEVALVPLFLLLGVWGGGRRRRAAIRFLLFNLGGGAMALVGLLAVVIWDCQHSPTGAITFSIDRPAGESASRQPNSPAGGREQQPRGQDDRGGLMIDHTAGQASSGTQRLLAVAVPLARLAACAIVMLLTVLSMIYGNARAFAQDNLRRLLAYGSIAQGGYLLLGLSVAIAAGTEPMHFDALAGMLFYLVVCGLATLGTFAALVHLGRADRPIEHVDELAGLGRTHPAVAGAMAVCLFSLMGVAPLAGFWSKLAILGGAMEVEPAAVGGVAIARPWFVALAVLGAVNAVVAAVYYLRVVGVIYFRMPLGRVRAEGGRAARAAVMACAFAIVGVGLASGPLWRWSLQASQSVEHWRHGSTTNDNRRVGPAVQCGRSADLRA